MSDTETLAHRVADLLQEMLDAGHPPNIVGDAAFLGGLPILMELTRSPTIEACLLAMASRFHGNEVLAPRELN